MGITNDIKYKFSTLNIAEKLIVLNVVIFIINALLVFLLQLRSDYIMQWFELPKGFTDFIMQPWSLVTYSFFHGGFMHILWNMVFLYFSARIFLNLFSAKYFLNVYFLGAISGGALFLLCYNIFPAFLGINSSLIGASAAIMAIFIFVCTYLPNQEVRIIFFNIKLWYIGAVFVLLDLIQLPLGNSGGHIAHLGGAMLGFVYAKKLQEGTDIGASFSNLLSFIGNMFSKNKKSPLKTVHKNKKRSNTTSSNKTSKGEHQKQIDAILDKISKSGYESLSKQEKDFLFKSGKE